MKIGNFGFELTDWRVEQEREQGIAKASKALSRAGSLTCARCGDEIDAARRLALPSARRCRDCQQDFETKQKARGRWCCLI